MRPSRLPTLLRRAVRALAITVVATALTGPAVVPLAAQGGPPPEVRAAVDAVVGMLRGTDDASLDAFVDAHLSDGFRDSFTGDGLREHLASLRQAARGNTDDVGVEADDEGLLLILSGADRVAFRLVLEPGTARVARLELSADGAGAVGEDHGATVQGHMRALEGLARGPDARARFVEEHLAADVRPGFRGGQGAALLERIGLAAAQAGRLMSDRGPDGYVLRFRGGADLDVTFEVDDAAPWAIVALRATDDVAPAAGSGAPPLTWASLDERLSALVDEGFSGTVLALRGADTVLYRGYGRADRAAGRPNTTETIYDIGSVPIDFTRAAVYLLVQRGRLSLDDPIGTVFPDVPYDKRAMTFRHLMEGTSGLPQFHHDDADADRDLSWIDRAEAERRILGTPLLYPPGAGSSPSHSAFVLLAAAVERVSGQTYGDFFRGNFAEPAGMTRTGFYGQRAGHPDEAFAVGYGASSVGARNIPPYWGETSWLIMGSGGMFSTPGDLHRFFHTLRSGAILQGEALRGYLARGSARGGSERGFSFVHAWSGGDDMVFLASNAQDAGPVTDVLVTLLIDLVRGGGGGAP